MPRSYPEHHHGSSKRGTSDQYKRLTFSSSTKAGEVSQRPCSSRSSTLSFEKSHCTICGRGERLIDTSTFYVDPKATPHPTSTSRRETWKKSTCASSSIRSPDDRDDTTRCTNTTGKPLNSVPGASRTNNGKEAISVPTKPGEGSVSTEVTTTHEMTETRTEITGNGKNGNGRNGNGKNGNGKSGNGKNDTDKSGTSTSNERKSSNGKNGHAQNGHSQNGQTQTIQTETAYGNGSGRNGDGKKSNGKNGNGKDGDVKNGTGKNENSKNGKDKNGKDKNGIEKAGNRRSGNGKGGNGKNGNGNNGKTGKNGNGKNGNSKNDNEKNGTGKNGNGKSGNGTNGHGKNGNGKNGNGKNVSGKNGNGKSCTDKNGPGKNGNSKSSRENNGIGNNGNGKNKKDDSKTVTDHSKTANGKGNGARKNGKNGNGNGSKSGNDHSKSGNGRANNGDRHTVTDFENYGTFQEPDEFGATGTETSPPTDVAEIPTVTGIDIRTEHTGTDSKATAEKTIEVHDAPQVASENTARTNATDADAQSTDMLYGDETSSEGRFPPTRGGTETSTAAGLSDFQLDATDTGATATENGRIAQFSASRGTACRTSDNGTHYRSETGASAVSECGSSSHRMRIIVSCKCGSNHCEVPIGTLAKIKYETRRREHHSHCFRR